MALFVNTRPAPFGAVTTLRITNSLDNLRMALIDWNSKRVTRAALSKLGDRELNDIGLSRADVDRL
ncbi:MAG: DUF1127 domain-containing protein [Alphaproteobacteria bacterium]|nr:DUF1127 domain-containing protein [Alphaproteobacteria bacterium]